MHEHFDAHKAYEHTDELAKMMRLAGTPGESQAQEYIRSAFAEMGVRVHDEEFSY